MPGFGFGHRFSRRRSFESGIPASNVQVLYGPNYGPRGPKRFLVSVWNQQPVGFCFETDNLSENLYAKWKARGVNTLKHQHPDFSIEGQAAAVLAACKAEGLMLLAQPRWQADLFGARPTALDYRDLAINDPYWRTNWIGYAFADEPDLYNRSESEHVTFFAGHVLAGVTKPGIVNFTSRLAAPVTSVGTESINWRTFLQQPSVNEITHDTYTWHQQTNDSSVDAGEADRNGGYHLSTWNSYGPVSNALDVSLISPNRVSRGRRFTTSVVGMAVHVPRNGPVTRGRSLDGGVTVFGPPLFDPPLRGDILLPTPLDYDPGDKSVGHYITTGRVDFTASAFPRGGLHSPARYVRDDIWSGIVHGSSHVLIFPQAPSGGSMVMTGYIDGPGNLLTITSNLPRGVNNLGGAMQVTRADNGVVVGWIRRDNPQTSGTPNGVGTYALDPAKATSVTTGSVGTPVQFRFWSAEGFAADGTNPANAAELVAATANIARMQAHPTGGNLLMNTAQGGRRAFTVLRCPDINGNPRAFKNDMTRAPIQAGYTSGGVAILDDAGDGPGWPFGWPMGFEGFHVIGDDGATYIYIKSLSNGDAPTWFPGYAPLGLPARAFGTFELAGFRRVGAGAAVEMTGTSGVIKAAQDDGAATWFYIDTASITQAEGNSGTTAYAITVRRGGNLSGTNTVTATASGIGANPANAADFQGGVFPSQVLSFGPSETVKTFTVNVVGDTAGELDETFAVTLSAPSVGTVLVASGKNTVTCTITNDDAPVIGAFVWLGNSLTGAPALSGSPAGATYLNVTETTNVTRGGITMRSRNGGITSANDFWFATTPGWRVDNVFAGPLFELPAGNWEIAVIAATQNFGGFGSQTVTVVDDPSGAATVRQSLPFNLTGLVCLMDTDGTSYTSAGTAVADAVNNLTYVPVTVSDLGGGNGLIQVYANDVVISAIALRQR